jgi:hypothetical protein
MRILLILFATFLLTSCFKCQGEVNQRLSSPGGAYVATVGKGGCAANTGLYQYLSVTIAGGTSAPERCGEPGSQIAGFPRIPNDASISIRWQSDDVLVARVRARGEKPDLGNIGCTHHDSMKIVLE